MSMADEVDESLLTPPLPAELMLQFAVPEPVLILDSDDEVEAPAIPVMSPQVQADATSTNAAATRILELFHAGRYDNI